MTDFDFDDWALGMENGFNDAMNNKFDAKNYSVYAVCEYALGYREGYDRFMNQPGRFGTGYMLNIYMTCWVEYLTFMQQIDNSLVGKILDEVSFRTPDYFLTEQTRALRCLLLKLWEKLK